MDLSTVIFLVIDESVDIVALLSARGFRTEFTGRELSADGWKADIAAFTGSVAVGQVADDAVPVVVSAAQYVAVDGVADRAVLVGVNIARVIYNDAFGERHHFLYLSYSQDGLEIHDPIVIIMLNLRLPGLPTVRTEDPGILAILEKVQEWATETLSRS